MPKYVFECHAEGCNLRFERNLKMGDHTDHPCPECKDPAPRVMDGEGFGFAFAKNESAPIGNTGVHKNDYPTADQIVGRDADQRWESYEGQKKVKEAARKMGGSPALIRHQGKDFIDYEPMTDVGREARRKLTKHAIKTMAEARDRSRSR